MKRLTADDDRAPGPFEPTSVETSSFISRGKFAAAEAAEHTTIIKENSFGRVGSGTVFVHVGLLYSSFKPAAVSLVTKALFRLVFFNPFCLFPL